MDDLRKDKPELGETILFCGHLEEESYHFFDKPENVEDPKDETQQLVEVQGPTGVFKVRWIILCDDCTRQRTKFDGVHPFDGILVKAVWAPNELQWSEHGKN